MKFIFNGDTLRSIDEKDVLLGMADKNGEWQGYGDISITPTGQAAQVISVTNNPIGSVAMRQAVNHTFPATEGIKTGTYTLQNYEALNTGDNIINDPITFTYDINTNGATITAVNITDESGTGTVSVTTANSTAATGTAAGSTAAAA